MSKRSHRGARGGRARSSDSLRSPSSAPFDRTSAMLASEAREVLSLALSEVSDPVLDDVVLLDVTAGPGGIVATLVAPAPLDPVREALDRIRRRLRSELAAQLQRRRVPELSLLLLPEPPREGGA